MENFRLSNNSKDCQFEFNIGGYIARIEYMKIGNGDFYLIHTEVPRELKGNGIATQLVKKTLEYIEINGLHMVPICPFVISYVKQHSEWLRLVKKGVKILTS